MREGFGVSLESLFNSHDCPSRSVDGWYVQSAKRTLRLDYPSRNESRFGGSNSRTPEDVRSRSRRTEMDSRNHDRERKQVR